MQTTIVIVTFRGGIIHKCIKNLQNNYQIIIVENSNNINFKKITNCPIIVNTSFNVRGEPIVCTIQDAYRCFMGTDLDMLVCGNFILYKEQQNTQLIQDYKSQFCID